MIFSNHNLIKQIFAGKSDVAALLCLPNILGFIIRKRKTADACFGNTVEDVQNSFILNVKVKNETF